MVETAIPLLLATGIGSAIIGLLSFLIYTQIRTRSDTAMVSFQLQPDKTVREFQALFAGHIMGLGGIGLFVVAGLVDVPALLTVARSILALYALTIAGVFYRWWRRFS